MSNKSHKLLLEKIEQWMRSGLNGSFTLNKSGGSFKAKVEIHGSPLEVLGSIKTDKSRLDIA